VVDNQSMTTQTERPPTYERVIGQMIISRKPIALDLGSWDLTETPTTWPKAGDPDAEPQRGSIWRASIRVIAVRGSVRKPKVVLGSISDSWVVADWRQDDVPQTPAEFMAAWDNRYGVDAWGTWDGQNLWSKDARPAYMTGVLDVLKPVLTSLPAVPQGFNGWWLQPRRSK
jgi:hypothetical protein